MWVFDVRNKLQTTSSHTQKRNHFDVLAVSLVSRYHPMVARKCQPSSESYISPESKTLFWILSAFPRNRRHFPQFKRKLLYINSLLESDRIFGKRTSSPKVERHLHYTNTLFGILTLFRILTQTAVQKLLFHCAFSFVNVLNILFWTFLRLYFLALISGVDGDQLAGKCYRAALVRVVQTKDAPTQLAL